MDCFFAETLHAIHRCTYLSDFGINDFVSSSYVGESARTTSLYTGEQQTQSSFMAAAFAVVLSGLAKRIRGKHQQTHVRRAVI